MVKEVKMYTIVCDNCGCDVTEGSDYSGWNEKEYVEEIRHDADWAKVEDKHYCTECFEYDEDYNIEILQVLKNK